MMPTEQNAFALYRLPNSTDIAFISGKASVVVNTEEVFNERSGFLFHPFSKNSGNKPYLIEGRTSIVTHTDIHKLLSALQLQALPGSVVSTDRSTYNSQIAGIKQAISEGTISKAILSRIELIDHDANELSDQFKALCQRYPHVMISLVHIPGVCTWLTATPEILLSISDGLLTTVSLAGTQLDNGTALDKVTWGDKELDEQQIVSDYITTLLAQHLGGPINVIGPQTVSTGQVLHLKTLFSVAVDSHTNIVPFLNAMHPTPAVCGKPKQAAMDMIDKTETHNRAYYAGYLGPLNMSDHTQLFVNLRCMQLFKGKAALYLGGGITAGSIADMEWRETEIKADTLLKVLHSKL